MLPLEGMFTTPEEIRGSRLQGMRDNYESRKSLPLLQQVAAGQGALMAEGVAGLFGLKSPEEAKASKVQKMMAGLQNSNDPDAILRVASELNKMGMTKEALFLTDRARQMRQQNTQESRAAAQFKTEQRNAQLQYKTNLLEFNELDRLVKAKPELREILSTTDISTPDGRQAAIQAANKVSFDTGMEMMKYFQAQDKLKATAESTGINRYASGLTDIVKDNNDNMFVQVTSLDKATNKPTVQYVPMAGSPATPTSSVSVVEQYGETATDKLGRDIATAGGEVTAKNFAETKTTAVTQIPNLKAQISGVDKAIELAGKIETGGFTNAIANQAQQFFGVTPKDKAEFALRTAEIMYSRLKPLFGGVISDSERAVIERVYATIQQNPEANIALLGVLKSSLEGELRRAEVVRDSENFEAYSESTKRSSDTVSWEELN